MNNPTQYCQNCGTKLNGEACCPRCQMATGKSRTSVLVEDSPPQGGRKTRLKGKWHMKRWFIVGGVAAGLLTTAILCGTIPEIIRSKKYMVEQRNIVKNEEKFLTAFRFSPEELLSRSKAGDAYSQYALGKLLMQNTPAGAPREYDRAGQFLLAACRGAEGTGNPQFAKRARFELLMWQGAIKSGRRQSYLYENDAAFRAEVNDFIKQAGLSDE